MGKQPAPSKLAKIVLTLTSYCGLVLAFFFSVIFIPIGLLDATTSPLFAFIYIIVGAYLLYRVLKCVRDLRARRLDLALVLFSRLTSSRNEVWIFAVLCAAAVAEFIALSVIPYPIALILLWPLMIVESFSYKAGVFIEFGLKARALAPISNTISAAVEAYYLAYLTRFLQWLRMRRA